jgi:hypothetical protein
MFASNEQACDQQHSSRESTFFPVDTVNYVATLKVTQMLEVEGNEAHDVFGW